MKHNYMAYQEATIAIFINSYHPQKDGKCKISIRVNHQLKKRYYLTKYSLTQDDFKNVMKSERPSEEAKKSADIIDIQPMFIWAAFEKRFLSNRGNRKQVATYFDELITEMNKEGRIGRAMACEFTKIILDRLRPNASFIDITPDFFKAV